MMMPQIEVRKNKTMRVYLDGCAIEYSYETPIAFKFSLMPEWVVHQNDWSVSTGSHISDISRDKDSRVSSAAFNAIWHDATEGILKDMMTDRVSAELMTQRINELKEQNP